MEDLKVTKGAVDGNVDVSLLERWMACQCKEVGVSSNQPTLRQEFQPWSNFKKAFALSSFWMSAQGHSHTYCISMRVVMPTPTALRSGLTRIPCRF